MRFILLFAFFFMLFLRADIILEGYLHPGDNENTMYTPEDPLTRYDESTYDYYLNNPSRFYLTEDVNITKIELVAPYGFETDSNLRIYIDGNLVATGNDGETFVDVDLYLTAGMHTIAVRGSCYHNGNERDCSFKNINDIDDFHFSAIRLVSDRGSSAINFIQRKHIGDTPDYICYWFGCYESNDNYDDLTNDNDKPFYYPDDFEDTSVSYDFNTSCSADQITFFISRIRDIHENGINKLNFYIDNSLIKSFDLNASDDSVYDLNLTYYGNLSPISNGKVEIVSGTFTGGGGYDDISWDELIIIPRCLPNNGNNVNYKFDAWDTFRDINDRNISTKIVSKDFSLTIASLDETGTNYQEFNGTVCVQIVDDLNRSFTPWQKLLFSDQNLSTYSGIVLSNALKKARVLIMWKRDIDDSCPLSVEDNRTLSTDNFAVRPDRFIIYPPSNQVYAGEDFNLSFAAKVFGSDTNATDYNETINGSFTVDANETKVGCENGTLTLASFSFTNGEAKNISANYDEIGDINVTVKEINGSEFARIDFDDTNDSERLIVSNTTTINVKPYEANITDLNFTVSTSQNWLYMIKNSNLKDMNVTLEAVLSVFSKNGTLLNDFNSSCYGEDVEIKFFYDVNSSGNIGITAVYLGTTNDANSSLEDINKTLRFDVALFKNGKAENRYAFDVNRSFDSPIDPIFVKLKEVNITTNVAKRLNGAKAGDDMNATFYFARVWPKDISTNKTDDNTTAKILVFSSIKNEFVKDFNETLVNWYQNSYHSNISYGNIVETNVTDTTILNTDVNINTSSSLDNNGTFNINISNSNALEGVFYIHLNISSWLWYLPKGFGEDYNYTIGSSCLSHPCIKYEYKAQTQGNAVESGGAFKGVDIEDINISDNKRGIRLFR